MVPALKRGVINHDNQDPEEEESDLFRLRAARKTKAEVDDSLIDPHLKTRTEHPSGSLSIPQQSLPPQATRKFKYLVFNPYHPSDRRCLLIVQFYSTYGSDRPCVCQYFHYIFPSSPKCPASGCRYASPPSPRPECPTFSRCYIPPSSPRRPTPSCHRHIFPSSPRRFTSGRRHYCFPSGPYHRHLQHSRYCSDSQPRCLLCSSAGQ
ncbi:hypothetical protein JOM56_003051 [Amanita muscaria]